MIWLGRKSVLWIMKKNERRKIKVEKLDRMLRLAEEMPSLLNDIFIFKIII